MKTILLRVFRVLMIRWMRNLDNQEIHFIDGDSSTLIVVIALIIVRECVLKRRHKRSTSPPQS